MGKQAAVKDNGVSDEELNAILGLDDGNEVVASEVEAELDALADLESEVVEPPAKKAKTKKAKAKAKPKAEAKPESEKTKRVEPKMAPGSKPSAVIEAKIGDEFPDLCVRNEAESKLKGEAKAEHVATMLEDIDALPKKVGEKATNVFRHLNSGVELSVYTHDAIVFLRESKDGQCTVADLKAHYAAPSTGVRNKPYSSGTAGAQSSQMKTLLPYLGIADVDGTTMTLRDDSLLVDMLAQ